MNYLAHAVLSGPDPLWRLGGYLGDHVRGDRWRGYPDEAGRGILLHRRIDSYTDAHPAFRSSREMIGPTYRRYAGIMLDVFNDHFLARRFEQYVRESLEAFAESCYQLLDRHAHLLPTSLARFAAYQKSTDLLVSYRNRSFLDQVFMGIAGRLSRPGPIARATAELDRLETSLDANFQQLFPDLQSFARETRLELGARTLGQGPGSKLRQGAGPPAKSS